MGHPSRNSRNPSKLSAIRGVCFDLDGVIIETMPLHARAWRLAAKRFGLEAPRRDIYLWEGESGAVTADTLIRRAAKRSNPETAKRLLLEKERLFRGWAEHVHIYTSLVDAAFKLRASGLKLALVTGTSLGEVLKVVPRRALSPFHALITGDRVQRGKPDPEPYRRSFSQLGIHPNQACVIENAPYGITSARRARAGWVIGLASSLPGHFLSQASQVVPNRRSLLTILLELARIRR